MKNVLLILIFLSTFNAVTQNSTREGVAFVIGLVLYGQNYDFDDNPANEYPSPWLDISTGVTDGQVLNIISRLDYDDGITPFPFLNDGSSNFHPSGLMPRAAAILAVVEAWDIPITNDFSSPYNDIPDGYALLPWINAAYNLNIIGGSNFFPNDPIQNDDIIDWVSEAENSQYGNVSNSVLNDEDNYFLPHLYLPENLGMFKGLEQGVFSHYAKNSFVIPDIQMSLNFSHFYSTSMVELPESFFPIQPLGRGWSHTYNIYSQRQYVDADGDGDDDEVHYITWADGTLHIYNEDDEEWITEGVYNELEEYSSNGSRYLEIDTKDHTNYKFRRIDSDRDIYYLIEITDKNGNDIEIEYESAEADDMERIERIISPSGIGLEFTYENDSDLIDEVEDPIGREIDFGYSNGRLRRFYDAKNNETEYFYVTNNTSNNFERFLLKEVELPRGNSIKASYDSDKDGYLSSYQVNNNDPVTYDIDVDYSESMPITINMDVPMPNGSTDQHTSEYNGLGLLETFQSGTDDIVIDYPSPSSSNPFLPSQVSNHNIDIEYEYDNNGNVEEIDYENGERLYQFDWNNENELVWSEDPRGNRTDYDYDNDHNLIKITDPNNNSINLGYFSNGNLMSVTNQEDITIDFTYYNDGTLQTFSAPENIGGSFAYDDINRLTFKNINGLESSYTYDDNDNIETFKNSGQLTTVFSYDDNDNVTTITNANNVQTVFDYNSKDQLTSETFGTLETEYNYNDDDTIDEVEKPSGQTIVIDYTSDGQYNGSGTVTDVDYDSDERVESIESIDLKYNFEYDNLNQINLVEIEGQNRNVSYDYDAAGNIIRIYYPNSGSNANVRYTYDDKNRLIKTRAINFNNIPNTDIAEYQYLDDDRIKQITYGNGFVANYFYDDAGRPTGINHTKPTGVISYDETRVLNNRGNVTLHQIGYISYQEIVYTPPTEEQNFQYNDNNHVISDGFSLDVDGNTTNAPIGVFTYDIDDQVRTRATNGVSIEMEYDAFGNRTKKTISNNPDTEYLWDIISKNIIQEYTAGAGEPESFIYGLGLEARIFGGVIIYYQGDLRGNVVLITNDAGSNFRDYQYGPFGHIDNVNPGPSPDVNHYTFLGKQGIIEDDREAGLYYIRARYYDASIGRFITEDPVQSSNLYAYGGNNPIKNIDPSGMYWESAADVLFIAYSYDQWNKNPDIVNSGALAFDGVSLLLPIVAGLGTVVKTGVSSVNQLDNLSTARNLGKAGEESSIVNKYKGRIPSFTGTKNYRIPDGLTNSALFEVKNVKSLSYTNQLRDFLHFSEANPNQLQFLLYTRAKTKLSSPLKKLISEGRITHMHIPN
jgi:RHS repeat-associated protein